jgi:hypothetical protein
MSDARLFVVVGARQQSAQMNFGEKAWGELAKKVHSPFGHIPQMSGKTLGERTGIQTFTIM